MSDAATDPDPASAASRRKRPPAWGVLAFLAVLGLLVVANQLITHSGPPIRWIEDDVEAAFRQARQEKKNVFLYLYEPNDPIHLRNEREVFAKRWAREPLSLAVCCRVAVNRNRRLADKYVYQESPLFLVLTPEGNALGRIDGPAIQKLQFRTHIGGFASGSY